MSKGNWKKVIAIIHLKGKGLIMGKRANWIGGLMLLLLLYLIMLGALLYFFAPGIKENFEKGAYIERFCRYIDREKDKGDVTYKVAFYSPYESVMRNASVEKKPTDEIHLSLEALLKGPGEEEIKEGLVSYIPKGTSLVGVTIEDGIAFVDLSEEIKESEDLKKAYEQVSRTVESVYPGVRAILLSNGDPLYP